LGAQAGLDDQVEASYRAGPDGDRLPYDMSDTSAPLAASVAAVQAILGRQRRDLGLGGRLHLLGWSLGGAVLFEAAAELVERDGVWRDAFASIVTLSSPLNGCDVDGVSALGDIAAGPAGRELCERGSDPLHRQRTGARAIRLRSLGVRLLTLGAAEDAVVTPADSIVPYDERYMMRPRARLGADFGERRLGHGAILNDPAAWKLVLDAVRAV
jgi:pimeloyl-ACP methyl ester carboxylesterase